VLFLVHRFFSPWWRRRQVPPKRRFLQEPHGVTTQKTPFFIIELVTKIGKIIKFTRSEIVQQQHCGVVFLGFPIWMSVGTLDILTEVLSSFLVLPIKFSDSTFIRSRALPFESTFSKMFVNYIHNHEICWDCAVYGNDIKRKNRIITEMT
jgi:hypothetical protein